MHRAAIVVCSLAVGCTSVADELSQAPDIESGVVRADRERVVIFVDGSEDSKAAAAVYRAYFENERQLASTSVSVTRPGRRSWARLDRAADYVPLGGRLWVVWLAQESDDFVFEQAVHSVAEGPHHEAVIVDHRCSPERTPGIVRWRGRRAEFVTRSADGNGRGSNTWDRRERPANVGFLGVRCGSAARESAADVVAGLRRGRDGDHDGMVTLAEVAASSDAIVASGVDLAVGEARLADPRPRRAVEGFVEPVKHIPTGSYSRGCVAADDECESDELPPRRVWLHGFTIDTHEVTWGEYAECVVDGNCPPVDPDRCYVYDPDRGFVLERLDVASIDAEAPMTCATWTQAEALCQWRGQHLPTEAQWERAARGRVHAKHLWSDATPDCSEAVHDGCDGAHQGADTFAHALVLAQDARLNTVGIADMVGNLSEWTLDWYDEDAYEHRLHVRNPVGPRRGEVKVVRGGSFYDPPTFLRLSYRYGLSPQFGYDIVGFRCAR